MAGGKAIHASPRPLCAATAPADAAEGCNGRGECGAVSSPVYLVNGDLVDMKDEPIQTLEELLGEQKSAVFNPDINPLAPAAQEEAEEGEDPETKEIGYVDKLRCVC